MNSLGLYVLLSVQILVIIYVLFQPGYYSTSGSKDIDFSPKLKSIDLTRPVFNEPTRPAVMPINMEQDVIQNYNQLGFVHQENSESLPLYGRPTYAGSDQYEYYIQDGSRNHIRIPIETPRKNNNELYDEDAIQINSLEGDYIVSLYPREKLRYIPYLY
jgi:hypothetical protein